MTKKVIELLRSGNFTIIYHDNQCCSLYKGHVKIDDIEEDAKTEFEFDDLGQDGYLPSVVQALVKALGGKSDSI